MSATNPSHESVSFGNESFTTVEVDETHINIRNCEKNTIYTVTSVGGVSECTCPHYKYRCAAKGEHCKHIEAIEEAHSDETQISGPYTGFDCYGNVDHTYWKCENCGAEATRKGALEDCC